jgi:hypothetical protein
MSSTCSSTDRTQSAELVFDPEMLHRWVRNPEQTLRDWFGRQGELMQHVKPIM